jgi:hypothetical protein
MRPLFQTILVDVALVSATVLVLVGNTFVNGLGGLIFLGS